MYLGVDVEEICLIINKWKGTYNKDIYKVLNHFGYSYKWKRITPKNDWIPDGSIVKIGFTDAPQTHFTLKINGKFYDPSEGILDDYSFDDRIQFISYIQIIN